MRIWFDAFAAQYVRELADGELELSLHLSDLAEIEQWILSWGVHARALAPKALTVRLRDIIRRQAEYYGA